MSAERPELTHCSACGRKIRYERSAMNWRFKTGKNHASGCRRSGLSPDVSRAWLDTKVAAASRGGTGDG